MILFYALSAIAGALFFKWFGTAGGTVAVISLALALAILVSGQRDGGSM